ncbi:MAG: hypothetical protein ABJB04_01915 [Betaproteobacteria bacterium]
MRFLQASLTVGCVLIALPASAQSLNQLAKQQGCTSTPIMVDGTDLYKCQTQSAMSYFSGPPPVTSAPGSTRRSNGTSSRAPTPANFPRVDSHTQRGRDDVRKRVLTEELATEQKMMTESEVLLQHGAVPGAEETVTSPKYIDRITKLRQTVINHAKNIQALNKEIERVR